MYDTIIWRENDIVNSLTYICIVDYSKLINWRSPLQILGVSGVLFHFYDISWGGGGIL